MKHLIADLCPQIKARAVTIGWCATNKRKALPFADIWWRFYVNTGAGMLIHGPTASISVPARRLVILPAWITWHIENTRSYDHIFVEVECPQLSAAAVHSSFDRAHIISQQCGKLFVESALHIYKNSDDSSQAPSESLSEQLPKQLSKQHSTAIGNTLSAGVDLAMAELAPSLQTAMQDLSAPHPLLQNIMEYIHHDISADLRIPTLAQIFHCSPKHITNIFNHTLQQSPASYIREQRLIHACKLLRATDLSIEHIAAAAGFANRDYLSRFMQQHMHIAPAAYRKSG